MLAAVDSGAYKFLLLLHIMAAIVGFGAVVLNGVYGAEAKKRQGVEGAAIGEANFRVSKLGEYFIYSVPIWGFGLIGMSDKTWKFSQTWLWLALLLYIVGLGVSHGVMIPSAKKMNTLARELAGGPPPGGVTGGPPPQAAEMDALSKKLAAGGAFLNVLLTVIVILMIWKPGT